MDKGKRRSSKTMTSNVEDRQKRFENATCGRGFFRKREKKSSVFKTIEIVWTGPYTHRQTPLKRVQLLVIANLFFIGQFEICMENF